MRPHLYRALAIAAALAPTALFATTAADLCSLVADPCNVSATLTITPGSTLDLGARALQLLPGANLQFVGGAVTINAGSLTMQPGSTLSGAGSPNGGNLVVRTTGPIDLQELGGTRARIDVTSDGTGGLIDLASTGSTLRSGGDLLANGTGVAGNGGTIILHALGPIAIEGSVSAVAGNQGVGGDISITADFGTLDIGEVIDASGGEGGGGSIALNAGFDVVTRAKLDVRGGGFSGDGGSVDILAGGAAQIFAPIFGPATGTAVAGGGDGADVQITAIRGSALLGGQITVIGGAPDGAGGSLSVDAGIDITQVADQLANGTGLDSCGGDVDLVARRNITLNRIDVSAGTCGAGNVTAQAFDTITALGQILGDSPTEGIGGFILFRAANTSVRGLLRANGPTGTVKVQACTLNVADAATLRAVGAGSLVQLEASGQMALRGSVQAGPLGANHFEYRNPSKPPSFTPREVTPSPTVLLNPALPPCAGEVTTTTVTTTTTTTSGTGPSSTSTTSTTTATASSSTTTTIPGELTFATRGSRSGCFLQWKVRSPGTIPSNSVPQTTQACIDGDPSCDADGIADGACTFTVRGCLAVDDPQLPLCQPDAITAVNIQHPTPLSTTDAIEQMNGTALADAFGNLGAKVVSQRTVLHAGGPVTQRNRCTAPVSIVVPHPVGLVGKALLIADATANDRQQQRRNRVTLVCAPQSGVCGNGVVELGEQCDDGNTQVCDGCSPACRIEACGNGVRECFEQCDDGPQNGTPGDPCGPECGFAAPGSRIPGGGPTATDCELEYGLSLSTVNVDRHERPTPRQTCLDDDPGCDFDPTPGTCRFHAWLCAGAPDSRLTCAGTAIDRVAVEKPVTGPLAQSLATAITTLGLPSSGATVCSPRFDIDVPTGRAGVSLRTRTTSGAGLADRDQLRLVCGTVGRRSGR